MNVWKMYVIDGRYGKWNFSLMRSYGTVVSRDMQLEIDTLVTLVVL